MSQDLYYLYCLSSQPLALSTELKQTTIGGISVIYRLVPHAVFGQEALSQHIKDLAWVTQQAQEHSAVVQFCHTQASVMPMRFPTLFETWEGVQASILQYRESYTHFLAKIQNKSEWTVRLYAQEDILKMHLAKNVPHLATLQTNLQQASAGKAFILKKQYETALNNTIDNFVQQQIQIVLEQIQANTIEGMAIPLKYPQEDLETQKITAKYVFLVDNSRQDAFLATLQQFNAQLEPQGLSLQYSGGWAIYHFLPHA